MGPRPGTPARRSSSARQIGLRRRCLPISRSSSPSVGPRGPHGPARRPGQPVDVLVEAGAQAVGEAAPAGPLGGAHLDQLASAADQVDEGLTLAVGERPRRRGDGLREPRDHLGVQAVGLGQPARGTRPPAGPNGRRRTGSVTDLARVDDGGRQPGGREGHGDALLQAARGLEHDQRGSVVRQLLEELLDPGRIVRDREGVPGGQHMNVEPRLADIDADEAGEPIHAPALPRRCGLALAAQATVRANGR